MPIETQTLRPASAAPDFRPILFINGFLLMILAIAMLVPAMVDYASGGGDWGTFLASAAVTALAGGMITVGNKPAGPIKLETRQAFLLTVSIWLFATVFAALPFAFSTLQMSITDSFFESMSGITASGATVMSGLDNAPKGILLWRSILHWLGGIGIIVMAVALLPLLRIGGMQLFRMESSDKTEKIKPRVSEIAAAIFGLYTLFTLACMAALWAAGMDFFNAANHAMSTLATGGFSTSDSSAGQFASPLIHWIIILFMMIGGATFILFITPWKHNRWALLWDAQIRWYLGFMAFFSLLVTLWHWAANDVGLGQAFTDATFHVVSIVTTTGFATSDYSQWGGFAQVTFFILAFIGGCTGSTGGGIKIFRWQVLFAMAGIQIKRLIHPNGIFVIDFNRQMISDSVVRSVLGFMVLYFVSFAVLALLLTMTGLDAVTALSGSVASLGNVGPGLGEIIGPAGNYQPLPDTAKWLMAFGMLLGRLELLTVIAVLVPAFWRD